jgi:hypothetical protein
MASALHNWLALTLDTVAGKLQLDFRFQTSNVYIMSTMLPTGGLWTLEHRLTYAGIGTMGRDQAAATLARIMG